MIDKTYEDKLVISFISSQIDADRMDYLLRDAYYTGVSYGHFDMERILRVMRPTDDQIVIKSTVCMLLKIILCHVIKCIGKSIFIQ